MPVESTVILEGAEAIAREAGALLLEGFRGITGVRVKGGGGDLVTEYDERCEALIRERLAELTPEAEVVGEETGPDAASAAQAWHVDPIDGTTNFAHGHPWFCLSMGLWDADGGVVGIVHAPAMGLMYCAARGNGSRRNGDSISVSSTDRLDQALLATGFPHDRATREDNNYPEFVSLDARTHGVRRCAAAALELAVLADGGYDGFWDRGLSSWDVAAGALLIEEAGGAVTTLRGEPFALTPKVTILASNGHLHAPLNDALAHVGALPPGSQVQ